MNVNPFASAVQFYTLPIWTAFYFMVSALWDGRLLKEIRGVRDGVVGFVIETGHILYVLGMQLRKPAKWVFEAVVLYRGLPWLYDQAIEYDIIEEIDFSAGKSVFSTVLLAVVVMFFFAIFVVGHNDSIQVCDLCKAPASNQHHHHYTNGRNLCEEHHDAEFVRIQDEQIKEIELANIRRANSQTAPRSPPAQQFSPVPLPPGLPRRSTFDQSYSFGDGASRRSGDQPHTPTTPWYQQSRPAPKYRGAEGALSCDMESPVAYKGGRLNPMPYDKVPLALKAQRELKWETPRELRRSTRIARRRFL
ncbi:MAG: hypothetical protein Q9183_007288 [Haloplaca sp. 2 TL-2023]